MPTKLTADAVRAIFEDCLFRDDEIENGAAKSGIEMIPVEGIQHNFGLHKDRTESHRAEVRDLLAELPDEFKGGWSFLNIPQDRNGTLWGEHQNAEQLVVLGLGLGMMKCLMPRRMWSTMPGGMPYYSVDLDPAKEPAQP